MFLKCPVCIIISSRDRDRVRLLTCNSLDFFRVLHAVDSLIVQHKFRFNSKAILYQVCLYPTVFLWLFFVCQLKIVFYLSLITCNFCDMFIARFCENFIFWTTLISRFGAAQFTFHWQCYLTCPWIKWIDFMKGAITSKLRKRNSGTKCQQY